MPFGRERIEPNRPDWDYVPDQENTRGTEPPLKAAHAIFFPHVVPRHGHPQFLQRSVVGLHERPFVRATLLGVHVGQHVLTQILGTRTNAAHFPVEESHGRCWFARGVCRCGEPQAIAGPKVACTSVHCPLLALRRWSSASQEIPAIALAVTFLKSGFH